MSKTAKIISQKQDINLFGWFSSFKKYISIKEILSFYLTFGIPLVYLYGLVLIFAFAGTLRLSFNLVILGVVLAFLGITIWTTSMIQLGSAFGVLPRKQKRVVLGLYKYLRHPMYLGISLTYVGLSLANNSKQGLNFAMLIIVPLLLVRAYFEERKLR